MRPSIAPARGKPCAPILLADPDYHGTLAAARSLGARGVPVYIASNRLLASTRWSRHVTRTLPAPDVSEAERFLDWLVDLGEREPGIVLYPTSDDTAFLYASRAADLSRTFKTYQPGIDAIVRVLDKKRLYEAARQVGLETPQTWFPETDADVARIAREASFPLLVKSRTQALSSTHTKGIIVTERDRLSAHYREFVARARYGHLLHRHVPDARQAMIQSYVPEAAQQILMLAAFLDRSGEHFVARSAMKVLQRPRSLGVGLCFESIPLLLDLAAGVRRLAEKTGYFGVFSIEFVVQQGRHLLIDFNPRFYNQLALDIARGFDAPGLVHAGSMGECDQVEALTDSATGSDTCNRVLCDEFSMKFMLLAQRASGLLSDPDWRRWRAWREQRRGLMMDPIATPDDPLPGWVDVTTQVYGCLRHPRAFVKAIMLDRATF